jgi:uncharacterized membrane protein YuzA (DUF378 family)
MKNSKRTKTLRAISILSYCFIMLNGQMIALPFIFFIVYAMFGSEGALTAITSIAGFSGLILLLYLLRFEKSKRILLLEIGVFFLLCAPVCDRLASAPIETFNYPHFVVPAISFVICYFSSIVLSYSDIMKL